MIVYLITNLANSKRYVGITRRRLSDRWTVYRARHGSKHFLHAAIRAHGRGGFSVVELARADTPERLSRLEFHFIRLLKTRYPSGYNQTPGGGNRGAPSLETRAKMAAARRGKSNPMKGQKITEERRLQIVANLVGHPVTQEIRKKLSRRPRVGKGCYFYKPRGKWIASIRILGKPKFLGRFGTEAEAIQAYREACARLA